MGGVCSEGFWCVGATGWEVRERTGKGGVDGSL